MAKGSPTLPGQWVMRKFAIAFVVPATSGLKRESGVNPEQSPLL